MLFEIDPSAKTASATPPVGLAELGYRERYDLQEWVLSNPSLLGEDLFIVTDEYARFDRTRERLDLLAVDRRGKLVVVELKRSAVGSHADLQAIRYAAYCSTLRLQDVAEIHSDFRSRRGEAIGPEEARQRILNYVGSPDFTELDNQPRMILGAEEFPPEITASAMWLRSCDIDIRCVRLRPYKIGEHLILDASVLIPLPEAEEFIIRRERKEAEVAQQARDVSNSEEAQALYAGVIERLRGQSGFPHKSPPKTSALWYKNLGRNSYLGVVRRSDGIRVELYIDEGDRDFNRGVLAALEAEKDAIETEIGQKLVWDREGNARKCAVVAIRNTVPDETVDQTAAWAADQLIRFHASFGPRYEQAVSSANNSAAV
jgi:hypothetical protein